MKSNVELVDPKQFNLASPALNDDKSVAQFYVKWGNCTMGETIVAFRRGNKDNLHRNRNHLEGLS